MTSMTNDDGSITFKTRQKFLNRDIGSCQYNREVRRIILNDMDANGKLESCYWLSFSQTYQRKGGDKYVKADPWFDA